jgi:hypothetical protein
MLARKYDNYAWEEIEYERPVERVRKVKKVDYKLVRRRAAVLVLLVMVLILLRSHAVKAWSVQVMSLLH